MQFLLFRLFGHKPITNSLQPTTKFKTTFPNSKLSEKQWMREFNVGMLWDRKIIHID